MREIKLRAWCEDFGEFKMCYYEYNACDNGLWFDMVDNFHSSVVHHVMQYTGLKDKNGKEIYEGDICLIDVKEGRIKTTITSIEELWEGIGYRDGRKDIKMNPEIIGNIYEHPHLLTK